MESNLNEAPNKERIEKHFDVYCNLFIKQAEESIGQRALFPSLTSLSLLSYSLRTWNIVSAFLPSSPLPSFPVLPRASQALSWPHEHTSSQLYLRGGGKRSDGCKHSQFNIFSFTPSQEIRNIRMWEKKACGGWFLRDSKVARWMGAGGIGFVYSLLPLK